VGAGGLYEEQRRVRRYIHQFHDDGNWSHRVHVVELPAESAPEQDNFQNAA